MPPKAAAKGSALKMTSPEVKKAEVDVNIRSKTTVKSPSRDYPDANALATKYGVSAESISGGVPDTGLTMEQTMQFMQKQQQLVQKVESKNHEIGQLCTLLEAVEPMPGMDPEKYRRILENPDSDMVDFRDAKIVDLAKKSRKLQMLLTKERSNTEAANARAFELQQTVDTLRKELEQTIPMASNTQRDVRTIRASDSMLSTEDNQLTADAVAAATANLQKELAVSAKKVEDLRRKVEHVEDQNRTLSRALIKEVGDGATLEEAVDEGRKGRAQTIIMLKSKIKKLEQMVGGDSLVDGLTMASSLTGGPRTTATRKTNVDTQAEEELTYMTSVRKVAVDELSEAHQKLSDQYTALVAKHQGSKARVRTLEQESSKFRQQIKTVIAKTETDDKLIEALKAEISRLKEAHQKAQLEKRSDHIEARIQKASKEAASVALLQQEGELNRLRRLTKQQAEQMATQDRLIRELRAHQKQF